MKWTRNFTVDACSVGRINMFKCHIQLFTKHKPVYVSCCCMRIYGKLFWACDIMQNVLHTSYCIFIDEYRRTYCNKSAWNKNNDNMFRSTVGCSKRLTLVKVWISLSVKKFLTTITNMHKYFSHVVQLKLNLWFSSTIETFLLPDSL